MRRVALLRHRFFTIAMADSARHLRLTDEALRLAAELWARSRREGRPTSASLDLDVDLILAAQDLTYETGSELVAGTTNFRHLQPYLWSGAPQIHSSIFFGCTSSKNMAERVGCGLLLGGNDGFSL